MDRFIKDKIRVTYENLQNLSEKVIYEIPEVKYIPYGYKSAQEIPKVDESWQKFCRNERIYGKDKHFWFYTEIKTPSISGTQQLVFEIVTGHEDEWDATNPQGLLYLNGEIVQGIDVNHRQVPIEANKEYKILLYFYTGMEESYTDVMMNIKAIDTPVKQLYYDIKVPYDAAMCFKEDDYTHIKTIKYLEQTCNRINFRSPGTKEFYDSIEEARKYIKEEYYEKVCGNSDAVVSYVGHTHIDVAWMWTLAQTKEKVQRSFSTVLSLMDRYPEYIFMSSQPQLYDYLKKEEPDLYKKVKERVEQGRWEVEGAMWLEADCNLSSGESLIRQILHGKQFMKDEFGVDSHILWLPDVFGYSAALPQILKKSGIDQFVTSKISWSESNQLPLDSFMWEGIDGTDIFTYFLTAQEHGKDLSVDAQTTYVGMVNPKMNLGTWERYQQKEYNNEVIVTFGYGDGGGGPTEEMLETERRLEYGLPGMPKAQMSRAGDFLKRVENNFKENCKLMGRTPKWVGELYLELHRGTYTSIAKNKKNNRECEFLCQSAETLSVTDNLLCGSVYPKEVLHKSWQTLLLNQFHDIIPGSSIFEVYEDSDRQYSEVRKSVGKIKSDKLKNLADNVSEKGLLVYNPNSFVVSGYAKNEEEIIYAENIPPMGWKVIKNINADSEVNVFDKTVESEHYKICFDDNMNIISLFDKDNDREVIKTGTTANQLRIFEDYPRAWDNWEMSSYYKQKKWDINDVQSVTPITGNGFGGFRVVRKYNKSTITQTIIVYSNSRRIDVENVIDWHEHHVILKAAFPTNIHTNKASYEIQFGNVERPTHENTSWEAAKFEVCAQKWGDLSEEGYGVSILNNCKYGYSASGSEMSLTLIKCGTYPNPEADQGVHTFTYSLYPHKDSFKQGGTINEAYLLNRPLEVVSAKGAGKLPSEYSLISCDSPNIIIETVKAAENGKGIIVRLYDAWDKKSAPILNFGFDAEEIYLCDMMEQPVAKIGSGNSVKLNVSNFEIITLLIEGDIDL